MLVFDALVVIAAVITISIIAQGVIRLRRIAKPEIGGKQNAKKLTERIKRRCQVCHRYTNAEADVFINDKWYHNDCFVKEEDKKEKGN